MQINMKWILFNNKCKCTFLVYKPFKNEEYFNWLCCVYFFLVKFKLKLIYYLFYLFYNYNTKRIKE